MPPDGYTMATIPEETAEKLTQLMVEHELETMSKAVGFAVEGSRPNEDLSETELAHLLYQRLHSYETQL